MTPSKSSMEAARRVFTECNDRFGYPDTPLSPVEQEWVAAYALAIDDAVQVERAKLKTALEALTEIAGVPHMGDAHVVAREAIAAIGEEL